MAKPSLIFPATALLAAISSTAFGCGGWFEEAPPMLPYYLDRMPAKSFGQIALETTPKRPDVPAPDADALIQGISSKLPTEKREEWIAKVDDALAAARENYSDSGICNLLHDVRDALASNGTNKEVADYLKWRNEHDDWFSVMKSTPSGYEYPPTNTDITKSPHAQEIEKHLATASDAMRPQWIYLRGALGFRAGDRVECQTWFDRVWKEFPTHPRAEIAQFMSARCELVKSRQNSWEGVEMDGADPAKRNASLKENERKIKESHHTAISLFESYLAKYPKGRFVTDAYGWLGALVWADGDRAAALKDYAAQFEAKDHPEVHKSALFMCEDVLSGAKADDDALFAEAAKHPVVALGATYLAMNIKEADGAVDSEKLNSFQNESAQNQYERIQTKQWRQVVLPKLAAAVVAQKERYQPGDWPARYLAILAEAASAAGNQQQAIELTNLPASQLEGNDDLLLARGIAQQRGGHAAEAIATLRLLLEKFPQSQLAAGTRLKLALALQDDHHAGAAVVELKKLRKERVVANADYNNSDSVYPPAYDKLDETDSFTSPDISGAEAVQIDQIVDALYNFAPLAELADALTDAKADEALKSEIRAVIAERELAREDFAEAKKYQSDAQFALTVGPLEKLTANVATAKSPGAKAKAMDVLGDAWAAARGKVLVAPLDRASAKVTLFENNVDEDALRRRVNGLALGFKNTNRELEERDELRHASRWWMRAARLVPGKPLAATTRWKALNAMPQIASGSEYAFVRAVETDAAGVSRQLYDRLRKECPKSLEARKDAAYWSFPMPAPATGDEDFPGFDSDGDRQLSAIGQMGYTHLDYGAFGVTRDFAQDENEAWDAHFKEWKEIGERITALQEHSADWAAPKLAAEVNDLRKQARAIYGGAEEARFLNVLDDLALFLQAPKLSTETIKAYIELRLHFNRFIVEKTDLLQDQRMNELRDDPALKPVADYVDFIEDIRVSKDFSPAGYSDENGPVTKATTSYPKLEKYMREFLAKYPHSRKREAAMMVLARAVHWLTTPVLVATESGDQDSPDTSKDSAVYQIPPTMQAQEKFDARRALQPLNAYDHAFPKGQYAADIRDYRADVAWQQHNWPVALDLTMQTLNDPAHPDLQPEAAVRLANIFAELAEADHRADLLAVIHPRPKAIKLLQKYLDKTWRQQDHPLRYLGQYLADQLGFAFKEPANDGPKNAW
jgi:outer membrane protein assembly factor BamD (BamD/ComL family)